MRRVALLSSILLLSGFAGPWTCAGYSNGHPAPDGGLPDAALPDSGVADAGQDAGVLDAGGGCPSGATGLSVTPATTSETVTNATGTTPVTYAVSATLAGGGSSSLAPSNCSFAATRADDNPVGSFAQNVYTPPNVGGVDTVTASCCGLSGAATVNVVYDASVTAAGGSTASSWTGPTASGGPSIIYPSSETRFPMNLYGVVFQWTDPHNDPQFRLTFSGPGGTTTVYSPGNDPVCSGTGAFCWTADQTTWQDIAGSNAGSTVSVQIDGLKGAAGSKIYLGTPETLGFSRRGVPGVLFFWGTGNSGTYRASLSDGGYFENYVVPGTFVPDGGTVSCDGCHSFSRDGRMMSASVTDNNGNTNRWTMQVTATPPPFALETAYPISPNASGATTWWNQYDGYANISPDDSKLIFSPRQGGTLELVDSLTGALISAVQVGGSQIVGRTADWSPVQPSGKVAYEDVKGGISTLDVAYQSDGGVLFGSRQQIVPGVPGFDITQAGYDCGVLGNAQPGESCFPSFDGEGDQIAFATLASPYNGNSLALVASGGGTAVPLTNASSVINNQTGQPYYEDTMPTWSPTEDLHWVAFNSTRPYGAIIPGWQTQQIFIAAVDLSKLPGDPSYPAFWFPLQDPTQGNHLAYWVQDVRNYQQQTLTQTFDPCGSLATTFNSLTYSAQGVLGGSDVQFTIEVMNSIGGTVLGSWTGTASQCPSPVDLSTCGTGGPLPNAVYAKLTAQTVGTPPPTIGSVAVGNAACNTVPTSWSGTFEPCASSVPEFTSYTGMTYAALGIVPGVDDITFSVNITNTPGGPSLGTWTGSASSCPSPVTFATCGSSSPSPLPQGMYAQVQATMTGSAPPQFTQPPQIQALCPGN